MRLRSWNMRLGFFLRFYAFFASWCAEYCISEGSLNIFLYIKELFIICRLLYSAPIEMRSFASSLLCVFVFFFCGCVLLRFRFFFFLRLRSLKYAISFSEICVFVLQQKRKRCKLSSGEYCTSYRLHLRTQAIYIYTCMFLIFQIQHLNAYSHCKNIST